MCSYTKIELEAAGLLSTDFDTKESEGWLDIQSQSIFYEKKESLLFYSEYGDLLWSKAAKGELPLKSHKAEPLNFNLFKMTRIIVELSLNSGHRGLIFSWACCLIMNLAGGILRVQDQPITLEGLFSNEDAMFLRASFENVVLDESLNPPKEKYPLFSWPKKKHITGMFSYLKDKQEALPSLFFYMHGASKEDLAQEHKNLFYIES